jgi:hypothetical protein
MPKRTTHLTRTVVEQVPKVFRLESIRSWILGLALLTTLIPSLGMAWISYVQNCAALTDKIAEELQSVLDERTGVGKRVLGSTITSRPSRSGFRTTRN